MTGLERILRFALAGSAICMVVPGAHLLSRRVAAQINPKPIITKDSINLPAPCLGAFPCFLTKKFVPNLADPTSPRTILVDPRVPADVASATRYYRGIGASAEASTLRNFKIKNQFVLSDGLTPRNAGFQALYFNNGDLQLGREMHCNQNGAKIACYVSNYGPTPFPPGNTDDNNTTYPNSAQALSEVESVALNSPNPAHPFATVAMEYLGDPPPTKTGIIVREADGVTKNPEPPKSCLADYSGNVPPSNADVDTGLDVETGDIITVTATGAIWTGYCFMGRNSADGMSFNGGTDSPMDTAHEQALIGRVGQVGSGDPDAISKSYI
jgi:hypothetical protein